MRIAFSAKARRGHELVIIVAPVLDVVVQGDVVGVVLQVLQHGTVPVDPVAVVVARPGHDEFDVPVDPLHQLGRLEGELAVILGVLVPHLPLAVHLVAQGPVFHLVGFLVAVTAAQVRPVGAFLDIAVLDPVAGFVHRPRAEVHAEIGLGRGTAAPLDELIGAERVALAEAPCQVDARRRPACGPMPSSQW